MNHASYRKIPLEDIDDLIFAGEESYVSTR